MIYPHGHPAANYLLGHLVVTTENDSTFAFCNWYFFVGFGLLFGRILQQCKDMDKLYRIVLFISAPIMAAYIALTSVFGTMFLSKNGWYYAASLAESIGLLSIDMVLLSAFYFLQKKVPANKIPFLIEMSKNLTPIYVAQWCVIGFVDSVFCYLLGFVIPYWAEYVFGAALIVLTYWIAKGWRLLQKRFKKQRAEKQG